jgi:hypothetical protein
MLSSFCRLRQNASPAQSISVAFCTAAIFTFSSPGGFNYALWISTSLTQGPTPIHEILRGIELYAYHPNSDRHQRNIQFLGGNLCIPINGEEGPKKHQACHAPLTRENKINSKKPSCC